MAADQDQQNRPQQIGHTIAEIGEKTSLLVREEIELAKAEVSQKVSRLGKGVVVAMAAGVFAIFGLVFLGHFVSYFFWWLIGTDKPVFWGFLFTTVVLFVMAGIAAALGYRWIKKSSPPTPDMAIEEAKAIRDTVSQ